MKFFKALDNQVIFNSCGYFCPNCANTYTSPTIYAHILYDEKYHKFKLYAKCNKCYNVTPAFDEISKVIDTIEDLWISKEVNLFD